MTPRKELFIKIKEALGNITQLELVDLQRKQFANPKENYPTYWTGALIDIKSIAWESMVEQKQEGFCNVDVTLYCKDGWLDQHNGTADEEHGLIEIDLIDKIVEKLQFLQGDCFKPLHQTSDESEDSDGEIMSYKISFSTVLYRKINPKFRNVKLTHP
jgi:hypothetical protein